MAANSMMGAACGTGMAPCDGTKGLYCGGSGTSRTCLAIPYVENGMQCGNVGPGMFVGCAAGGNCYTAAGTIALTGEIGTCKAAASDGAACDTASGPPCLTPARCITTGGGTAGTCTVPDGTMCM